MAMAQRQCGNTEQHAGHRYHTAQFVLDEEPFNWVWCPGTSQYPIIVVATSRVNGEKYIRSLGLEDCVVVDSMERAQGRRCRGIIVTPAFVEKLLNTQWELAQAYSGAMHALVTTLPERDYELG